ncbi:MAG: hypothetical protein ACTS6G_00090 [Candidatus Hodgkinia cicadicola]
MKSNNRLNNLFVHQSCSSLSLSKLQSTSTLRKHKQTSYLPNVKQFISLISSF